MQHLRWEVRILRIPEMLGKMRRRLQEEARRAFLGLTMHKWLEKQLRQYYTKKHQKAVFRFLQTTVRRNSSTDVVNHLWLGRFVCLGSGFKGKRVHLDLCNLWDCMLSFSRLFSMILQDLWGRMQNASCTFSTLHLHFPALRHNSPTSNKYLIIFPTWYRTVIPFPCHSAGGLLNQPV